MAKKVVLFNPPAIPSYQDPYKHNYVPPLGLVSLKSYLEHFKQAEVVLLDGEIQSEDYIRQKIKELKPEFVGSASLLVSHKNALDILKFSKSMGAITLIGGHNATHLAREILDNNHFVDFVVMGDGENAMSRVVSREDVSTILNLAYRDKEGKVVLNRYENLSLDILPMPDYRGIDLSIYDSPSMEEGEITCRRYNRVYSHKGCANRSNSNGCLFCGRADRGVRFKTPLSFLEEILLLQKELGTDYAFDVGDDIMSNDFWLKEVADLKHRKFKKINLRMGCFGRANRVNQERASLLRKIGIEELVVGFESGDREIAHQLAKGSPKQNLETAKILLKNGINVYAMYVLGLPGESDLSLQNTIENAQQVIDLTRKGSSRGMVYSVLLEPHPGSPIFKTMVEKLPERYAGKDIFNPQEVQDDYFSLFFGLTNKDQINSFKHKLLAAQKKINS